MRSRIHIMGASGSGTSTLAYALADRLPHRSLDTDNYFWAHKYTEQTPVPERLERIKRDLSGPEPWILSGAVCGWGDELRSWFDLVIFLWISPELRMNRLRAREYERYGNDILPGRSRHEAHREFLEWAALYDTADKQVRSRKLHEGWMAQLNCPILRLEGDLTTEERVEAVLGRLSHDN
ncbi:AAA family ATPase [Paenibacillus tengchongensis]|uniref:AAA family ATPase n=1 Tax=Paenibacillus tengchongensis TaxID=2608684 RepID=UPI00124D7AD8|nr:AAA family ATPase [Paenibacillus tengchongensis]